jgi:replicative DNA helicase
MAQADSTVRKLPEPAAAVYRTAPHNIEAEQALLGAILVNNEAFYRVGDFLEPQHFFEPIHQKIFDLARSLIRANKLATPVTLKTFLPADIDIAGLNLSQYLARLAAEATTVINAEDYGRTIYDLAIRRHLILIGEEMVNEAFDAPVDSAPRQQIEDAERRLFELAETGRYDGGFQRFAQALTTAVDMAAHAFQRDGKLSGLATGLEDFDRMMGGLQQSDLVILAGRPGMGKTALATNIAYNVAKAWQGEVKPDGHMVSVNGGIVGFFSLEMSAEQLATRIIAEQTGIPSNKIRRGGISEADFEKIKDISIELQNLPFYVDETGGLSIAQLAARARRLKRQRGLDLLVIDYIQLLQGSTRRSSENRVQEVTEITLAPGGKPRRQAAAAFRPARIRFDRAGRRRGGLRFPRGILPPDAQAFGIAGRQIRGMAGGRRESARQGRSHHRQAAPRPDRHGGTAIRRRSHALLESGQDRTAAGPFLVVRF